MTRAEELAEILQEKGNLLLTSHISPDGDSIGSVLALGLALRSLSKHVVSVLPDPIPEIYQFLPGSGEILSPEKADTGALGDLDCVILLDSSDFERTGKVAEIIPQGIPIINIDHHLTNKGFGDYNYIDPEACATGELVYHLILAMDVPLDKDIATCLFVSIVTDTGSFRFSNTTPKAFQIAEKLVECGASPYEIAENVFETRSYLSLKLLGRVLDGLVLESGGRISWIAIPRSLLEEYEASEAETEGFANYARMVKGTEVSVLFREEEDGKIHVSLRSRGKVDVSRIAASLGGGGHARAAGCNLKGSMEDVKQQVLARVRESLEA